MSSAEHSTPARANRPVYRNINVLQIIHYRLPLAGFLSILHRVSGALLFLALPFVLMRIFDLSLTSEISFERLKGYVEAWPAKAVLLVLIWAYAHHFFAGLRYLVLDLHIGTDKHAAGRSAALCFVLSLLTTALLGARLFGLI